MITFSHVTKTYPGRLVFLAFNLVIALVLLVKSAGSIVSLGFGFRGGLFFASLYLGALVS